MGFDGNTLRRQNDPPGAKSPSGFGGDCWFLVVLPESGGWFCLGRAERYWEGVNREGLLDVPSGSPAH